jgi:penicillin-binding protein 2
MSVIHAPSEPKLDVRLLIFPVVLFCLLSGLALRLWYFQVVKAEELSEKALKTGRTRVEKLAPRGLIYDRKGVMLAGIRSKIVVTAVKNTIRQHPESLERVAAILGTPVAKLEEQLQRSTWRPSLPAPIAIDVPLKQATQIAESADDLPGIDVSSQPMRYYPDGKSFAHLLGYVWVPYEQDIARIEKFGRKPAQYVGKAGLEREYEKELMGTAGVERVEIGAKRKDPKIVGRDTPVPGSKLTLTIDNDLQQLAFQMMASKGFKGAAVAIEPATGEVLALVSSPSYDTRLFLNGISQTDYNRILNDASKPFVNRAIGDGASPGSTFKLLTAIAAAQAGIFDPNWHVHCGGGYRVGNRVTKCLGVHGSVNFKRALEKSCNTYFAALAVRTGMKQMQATAQQAGFGSRSGLDLSGEWPGRVISDELVKRYRKRVVYYPGDLVNFGIGQGELTTTPLQMANLAAMVANGGTVYRPHLVKEIRRPNEPSPERIQPEVAFRIDLPERFWQTMRDAMVGVVEQGTARAGKIDGFLWGGKTGSAEHGRFNEKTSHSWFIGFAPAVNPKIAIAVFVDSGGHGSTAAMPICKAMIEAYCKPERAFSNKSATLRRESR